MLALAICLIVALVILFVVTFVIYIKTPAPKTKDVIRINDENCSRCEQNCTLNRKDEE